MQYLQDNPGTGRRQGESFAAHFLLQGSRDTRGSGTYDNVSREYLQRYSRQFDFVWTNRKESLSKKKPAQEWPKWGIANKRSQRMLLGLEGKRDRVVCEMVKRTNKKLRPQEALVSTQIQWDVKVNTPSYYVNYMGVSHSPYDFTLSAARIPSPLTREQTALAKSGQKIPVEPIIQLVMPPLLIDGLIHALTDQKAKYEKTAAQQVKNNEIQRQLFKPAGTIN